MSGRKQDKRSIIIRKEEVVEGGHHGGAWKVAYADFVTAMMAFFLLMWLLNATSEEQRRGLADYFSPTSHLAATTSGTGQPFGGRTVNAEGHLLSDQGSIQMVKAQPYPTVDADDDSGDTPTQTSPPPEPGPAPARNGEESPSAPTRPRVIEARTPPAKDSSAKDSSADDLTQEIERREKANFERAADQIRDAVRADPALADLARQLQIDITPEGMRIQLLDADRTPMFSTGSAALNDRARAVLAKVAPVLLRMKEPLAIAGYTDSAPYRGPDRTNWDLSAERANATRRLLIEAGLPETRLRSVAGHADRDPLIPADPMAAANRRVAIVLLRERPAPAR